MNQEEADQNVVDEVSEEADSRSKVMRSEKLRISDLTNLRIYELTQAPANENRAVLFPAELKFLRFK